ncbi:glycoside hydrolase family 38 C-terminal domain-containing protein [Enterobacter sp.]|uniref:glycoside hydrolase family 38 N-terminal domain-containing protein n=1 Tax=Enterobacter sp. TaxID=42895 RepID=UPI00296F6F13|nr:glycoside hydrolase family 38 C-terminal domain-containing protein [Enterobacter sp.]
MSDQRIIHAVSHTHWDREWYFTTLDTQVFAVKAFSELIDALEANPTLIYHLDGQSSLLSDFLQIRPALTDRVNTLVKARRLLTGPWYTQPDLFNIATESMFRNLRIGIHHAQAAGGCMDVLYLPDTFGSHAQLPQIAAAFNLHNILLRRGYDPQHMGPTEMRWQAASGDVVKTAIIPFGYSLAHPERGGRYRNFSLHHFKLETWPLVEKLKQLTTSRHLLCPIGGDQVSCDAGFDRLIAKVDAHSDDRYIVSSYEDYFAALNENDLPLYEGEFRQPRLSRVHKTIGSSRYDIKKANDAAETQLIHQTEPLLALARANGLACSEEMLEKAWRMLLESHAHDSMGGCNSDETNRDVLTRCAHAQQTGDALFSLHAQLLLANLAADRDYRFLLVNGTSAPTVCVHDQVLISPASTFTLTDEQGVALEFVLLEQQRIRRPRAVLLTPDGEVETFSADYYYLNRVDILHAPVPRLGMAVFFVNCAEPVALPWMKPLRQTFIENQHYRISWHDQNLQLFDKRSQRTLTRLVQLSDLGNDGDLYDFSPLAGDHELRAGWMELVGVKQHPAKQEMTVASTLMLPECLNADRSGRSEQQKPVAVTLTVTLEEQLIRFHLDIDNQVREHRMQLIFDTGEAINAVQADMPFGWITRQNQNITDAQGFSERPVDIEPFMHQLRAHDDFHLFARGLKEYEYAGRELRVTLFRGAEHLGKDDLLWRPGRASGQRLATPEANLLGPLTFDFALCLAPLTPVARVEMAQRYRVNPTLWQWQCDQRCLHRLDNFDLFLPVHPVTVHQLLDDIPEGLALSGVDVLYGETLVRLYNPGEYPLTLPVHWQTCNALGEPLDKREVKPSEHVNVKLA